MLVRDFMTSKVRVASPALPLEKALLVMREARVRRLPVVENARLVGIITVSDIHRALGSPGYWGSGPRRPARAVGTVMTRNPSTVPPGETVERAALTMLDRKISGLPVVDNGALVGIITESDIFRALVKLLGFETRGARVSIELGGNGDILGTLRRRLGKFRVQSLATYRDRARGRWWAVARVRGKRG